MVQLSRAERARRRERIARRVSEGESIESLAEEHGLTVETIRRACLESGVITPTRRKGSATDFAILANLLNCLDLSLSDIARRRGVSRQRVWAVQRKAREAGIAVPERNPERSEA